MKTNNTNKIPVTLKWSKKVYEFDIDLTTVTSTTPYTGLMLKQHIYQLTNVPIERQKVMCKEGWKGILTDEFNFSVLGESIASLKLTLIGSAEVLKEPTIKTKFIEDMSLQEHKHIEEKAFQESLQQVKHMIPAIQCLPADRENDTQKRNQEDYAYSRLVHGLSQYEIENLLTKQQELESNSLLGQVVMTFGFEQQLAYINDIDVLEDGTIVAGVDNGHVQLWKHAERIADKIHSGDNNNISSKGVDSVLTLQYPTLTSTAALPAFATAGRGTISLWTNEAEIMAGFSSNLPYASPTDLIQISSQHQHVLCIASRYQITRPPSNRPRLVPQDDTGRQRLRQIEQQEAMLEESIERSSRTVQLYIGIVGTRPRPLLQAMELTTIAPITALSAFNNESATRSILAVGDEKGGIQLWSMTVDISAGNNRQEQKIQQVLFNPIYYYWLASSSENSLNNTQALIAQIEYNNKKKQLFVSTKQIPVTATDEANRRPTSQFIPIDVPTSQAVYIIDIQNLQHPRLLYCLNGHQDIVHHILPLPNGDVITAGGKLDATCQVWSNTQLIEANDNASSEVPILTKATTPNLCKDAGYVFGLVLLNDLKSSLVEKDGKRDDNDGDNKEAFAVAAVRYNLIKIIL